MADRIVRATAAGASIRAFACTTKETVETARQKHNSSPVVTAALGRLLTAGAMMGCMLKGEKDILTLKVNGSGPMKGMTVTADSSANVKGYPIVPQVLLHANDKGKLDVSGAVGIGILTVIKDMGLKEPYSGQTVLQTSEIAEDLTYYFATSEQTPSSVGLGVLMNLDNTVAEAGGFILQLMPFADEEVIVKLEENISRVSSVTAMLQEGKTPEEILGVLLEGLDMEIVDTIPTQFYCNCSRDKVEKAIASIGKKEVDEMIAEEKPVEINCHFCNTNYEFSREELIAISEKAVK